MVDQTLNVFEIYELLPRNNCQNCGENNCMAFAQKLIEGKKTMGGCTPLKEPHYEKNRQELEMLFNGV
ncbi:MAG: (Fe-S)-binding protein [Acetobacterium sp.]